MEVGGQFCAPDTLPPMEGALGAHWMGVWVGHGAGLGVVVGGGVPGPCQDSGPLSPISQPSAVPLNYLGSYSSCNIINCSHHAS
jgi:hypothetical protein